MVRVPYTWKVGVDNAFGYLTTADGRCRLVESRRFISTQGRSMGLTIRLDTGSALLMMADGTAATWQHVDAARACELAGIPQPAVDGRAETVRRLDPFHVERHTSAIFNAIVTLALGRRLPCAHALRAWRADRWDGTFNGPCLEQPETFAASVSERIACEGGAPRDAILSQLAQDAGLTADNTSHLELLRRTGWLEALTDLPVRVAYHARVLDAARRARREIRRAGETQLALI
jgi:hypothetical protein